MGEWLVKILVIGFAAWAIWSILQPRYAFEIRVESGRPHVRKGKVTTAFLGRVEAVCRENGLVHGWIGGVLREQRVSLRFSRDFPPVPQQRLRNEWTLTA